MSEHDPKHVKLPKCDLLEKTFALAKEKNLTFREARLELARRGQAAKAEKNLRIKKHGELLRKKGLS